MSIPQSEYTAIAVSVAGSKRPCRQFYSCGQPCRCVNLARHIYDAKKHVSKIAEPQKRMMDRCVAACARKPKIAKHDGASCQGTQPMAQISLSGNSCFGRKHGRTRDGTLAWNARLEQPGLGRPGSGIITRLARVRNSLAAQSRKLCSEKSQYMQL